MKLIDLRRWAERVNPGGVEAHSDTVLSLPQGLVRFHWNGQPAVGVGSDADRGLAVPVEPDKALGQGEHRIGVGLDAARIHALSPSAQVDQLHGVLSSEGVPK